VQFLLFDAYAIYCQVDALFLQLTS